MRNTSFDKIFDFVIEHEGFKSFNPHDLGGQTIFGITKRFYPKTFDLFIRFGFDQERCREIAYHFYLHEFWKKAKIDKLPYPVNFYVFDFAVNTGKKRAICTLQRVINRFCPIDYGTYSFTKITIDGIIGEKETIPATMALMDIAKCHFCYSYITARIDFYLCLRHFKEFGRGWIRRVLDLVKNFPF